MYGLIAKLRALPGKRDELLAILTGATGHMPGCISYIIARDPADTTALWITEIWQDADSHKASLSLPQVQDAISRARPIIAGFDFRFETEPAGGYGLPGPGGQGPGGQGSS